MCIRDSLPGPAAGPPRSCNVPMHDPALQAMLSTEWAQPGGSQTRSVLAPLQARFLTSGLLNNANNAALAACISWAACRSVLCLACACNALSVMPLLNVTRRFLLSCARHSRGVCGPAVVHLLLNKLNIEQTKS